MPNKSLPARAKPKEFTETPDAKNNCPMAKRPEAKRIANLRPKRSAKYPAKTDKKIFGRKYSEKNRLYCFADKFISYLSIIKESIRLVVAFGAELDYRSRRF